jgi:hypothetical protein
MDDLIEKDEMGRLFGTYRRERKYLLRFRCKFLREDIVSKTYAFQENAFEIDFKHTHAHIYTDIIM